MQPQIPNNSSIPIRTIAFEYAPYGVDIKIDGQPIVEIIKECAARHYDNNPEIASIYHRKDRYTESAVEVPFILQDGLDGFEATVADLPIKNCDEALLRICDCGYAGCSSVTVRMRTSEHYIEWSILQHPGSRFGPFTGFGTMTFDRQQYQNACEKIHSESPPPNSSFSPSS